MPGTRIEFVNLMKSVLILTSRPGDGAALRDLLADAGHKTEVARDMRNVADRTSRPDVIVADLEPWTREGRALIERSQQDLEAPKVIILSARAPTSRASQSVRFLSKPVALGELESAILGAEVNCPVDVA